MTAIPHVRVRPGGPGFGSRSGNSVRARLIRPGARHSEESGGRGASGGSARRRRGSDLASEAVVAGLSVNGSVAAPRMAPGIRRWPLSGGLPANLRLVVAGRRIRLGRGAFALASLAALTTILVTLLVLNTALTTDSFALQQLRVRDSRLAIEEQELLGKLSFAQSPVGLQTKARELGMVPATSPVFLRLADRSVLGEGDPARMPPPPAKPKVRDKQRNQASPNETVASGPGGESGAELVTPGGSVPAAPVVPVAPGVSSGQVPAGTVGPGDGGGETGVGLVEAVR